MARLARVEVFAADEVAVVHVMNRIVRRCFLLGYDSVTGKNYDHRKVWIDQQLAHQARHFGIDLLCQAIMSIHLHLVLRARPDVVQEWNSEEVARRWLMLCPERRDENRRPMEPTEFEINRLVNNKEKLASVRSRLSDISWWMRLLCQNIAQRANREDGEVGKFWQARYRSVRLLDEIAILSCAAYVDLNPIRAAMAQTIANSDFTSAQKRSQALAVESHRQIPPESARCDGHPDNPPAAVRNEYSEAVDLRSSQHLSPVELRERDGRPGPDANLDRVRCSNKGFLLISTPSICRCWNGQFVNSERQWQAGSQSGSGGCSNVWGFRRQRGTSWFAILAGCSVSLRGNLWWLTATLPESVNIAIEPVRRFANYSQASESATWAFLIPSCCLRIAFIFDSPCRAAATRFAACRFTDAISHQAVISSFRARDRCHSVTLPGSRTIKISGSSPPFIRV